MRILWINFRLTNLTSVEDITLRSEVGDKTFKNT